MLKYAKSRNTDPHFDPVSVRGVVSRVQTALPSIRIRLRNLRPGFHPIYPKRKEKCVPKYNPYWSTHGGAWLKRSRVFPEVNDNGYKQIKRIERAGKRNNDANKLNKLNKHI